MYVRAQDLLPSRKIVTYIWSEISIHVGGTRSALAAKEKNTTNKHTFQFQWCSVRTLELKNEYRSTCYSSRHLLCFSNCLSFLFQSVWNFACWSLAILRGTIFRVHQRTMPTLLRIPAYERRPRTSFINIEPVDRRRHGKAVVVRLFWISC